MNKVMSAFFAGSAFPMFLLPLLVALLYHLKMVNGEVSLLLPLMPLIWGFWNLLFHLVPDRWLGKERGVVRFFEGFILACLLISIFVFHFHLPQQVGLPAQCVPFLVIAVPLVYGVLWRYLVWPLERVL